MTRAHAASACQSYSPPPAHHHLLPRSEPHDFASDRCRQRAALVVLALSAIDGERTCRAPCSRVGSQPVCNARPLRST
eukprot:1695099-Prymnesium_polylepis.2